MKEDYKQIRNSILRIMSNGQDNGYIGFHKFVTDICAEYHLDITEDNASHNHDSNQNVVSIDVKGERGYHILVTMYFLIKEMERNHVILLNKNDNGQEYLWNIEGKNDSGTSSKISGDMYKFMKANIQANIWLSPDFEWFKKNGFVSKELFEARKQAKYAFWTFVASVVALILSILH